MLAADDFYSVQLESASVTGGYAAVRANLVAKPLLNASFVTTTPGRVVTMRF